MMLTSKTYRTDLHEFIECPAGQSPSKNGVWELVGYAGGDNGVRTLWARWLAENPIRQSVEAERRRVMGILQRQMDELRRSVLWPSDMIPSQREHIERSFSRFYENVKIQVVQPEPGCDPALEGKP